MGSTWSRWRQERRDRVEEHNFDRMVRRLRSKRNNERRRNHEPSLADHLQELHAMREELERIRPTLISDPLSDDDRVAVLREDVATFRSLYEDRPQENRTQPRVVHTGDADVDLVINQEIQSMTRSEIAANFEAPSLINDDNVESSDSGSGSSDSGSGSSSSSDVDSISILRGSGPRLPPNDNNGAEVGINVSSPEVEINVSETREDDQHIINVDTNSMIPPLAKSTEDAHVKMEKSSDQADQTDQTSQMPQKYCLICIDAPSSGNALISCWRCTASWCFKHYAKMERKECPQCRASLLALSTSSGGIDSVDVGLRNESTRSNGNATSSSNSRPNIVDNIMSSGRSTTTSTNVFGQTLADLVLQSNNRTITVNGHRLRRPGESRTATTSGIQFGRNGNLVLGNGRNEQITINRGGGVTIVRTRAFA